MATDHMSTSAAARVGGRRWLTPILGLLGLLLALASATPARAITGGAPDGAGHPSVGAQVIVTPDGNFFFCSGTLISPTVYLTAAHCTSFLEALIDEGAISLDNLYVSFDSDNAGSEGLIPAQDIISHPAYSGKNQTAINDVGVIILDAADTAGIPTATLAPAGYLDQLDRAGALSVATEFVAVGYGTTIQWPPPAIIPIDGVRRVVTTEFRSLRKNWLQTTQVQSPGVDSGGTCGGDSGGPNFYVDGSGAEVLVSVTSWGDPLCISTNITQRVDTPSVQAFLRSVLDAQ